MIDSATGRVNRSAVHLDELPGNGQTQTESTALAGDAGIRLAETLEYVRQEFRGNTNAGVADRDFQMRVHALEADLHFAAAVCELDGIRQEIPQHLLQALRIPGHGCRVWIDDRLDVYSLRVRRRSNNVDGAADDVRKLNRLDVQSNLSGDDPRDVKDILDNLRQ